MLHINEGKKLKENLLAQIVLLIIGGFFLGSLPWSVWLSKFKSADPRLVGDGNPGAFNTWKASGKWIGTIVLLLDIAKGYLPAHVAQLELSWGWWIPFIASSPIYGHRWSPFLRGKGGIGLAAYIGLWSAMPGPWASFVLGVLFLIFIMILRQDRFKSVTLATLLFALYLLFSPHALILLSTWCLTTPLLWFGYKRPKTVLN
ncbi:glycerol-3-phosphate acyltransferase [Alicyclobacillus sp. TC]|nr:glycerol-3-phosphate acyltransferase [Alicyclobacillus sp. TC]